MWKFFTAIVFLSVFCECKTDGPLLDKLINKGNRQKRLLFYDEQGNLVKTFGNSLYYLDQNEQRNPLYWSFLNAFISPLRSTIMKETPIAYMIPVSDAVIQQINTDPLYHNKLFFLSTINPIVEKNAICEGKRVQIPSPNLCSNFLNCWDGWAFEQECPAGLMFSNYGYCDYADNVNCHNRKVKENPEPQCKSDFESFRNKANCNEFFVCVNSYPVRFKCPTELVYSEYLGICDYAYRVDCNITQDASPVASTVQPPDSTTTTSQTESTSAKDITSTSTPLVKAEPDFNVFKKYEYNKESWTSTHVAMSRQDAIRQLNLKNLANISTQ